jgi:hypothetical protein
MRRGLCIVLGLALAGCASAGRHPVAPSAPRATVAPAGQLQPSPNRPVGLVLAVDGTNWTVIVDVSPYASLPADLTGRILLARNPGDLHPTARLQASAYLRGRTLGARLVEGQPAVGDEVVLPPAAPAVVAPPPPSPPAPN